MVGFVLGRKTTIIKNVCSKDIWNYSGSDQKCYGRQVINYNLFE